MAIITHCIAATKYQESLIHRKLDLVSDKNLSNYVYDKEKKTCPSCYEETKTVIHCIRLSLPTTYSFKQMHAKCKFRLFKLEEKIIVQNEICLA